jgi:hypothetical protein
MGDGVAASPLPAVPHIPSLLANPFRTNLVAPDHPGPEVMLESNSVHQVFWVRLNEWGGGFNERGRAALSRYL